MSYDYNKYMQNYNKKNIEFISLRLHKEKDKDILDAVNMNNKQGSIKELIRKGLMNRRTKE